MDGSDRVVAMAEEEVSAPAGWRGLLSGDNLFRSLALTGGIAVEAFSVFITTTILPSVVHEIGGLNYYAWNTAIFAVASILGSALAARLLASFGPRAGYAATALAFAAGALICALAPSMPVMLAGRFVQGLGGGGLVTLPYAMIRRMYAPALWPRAMALLSSTWAICTLLGPAVGGVFAQFGMWRVAFLSLVGAAILFTVMALAILPRRAASEAQLTRIPFAQLGLLVAGVLAASWSSLATTLTQTATGLLLAVAALVLLAELERRSPRRLLPRGALQAGSLLGALYAVTAVLTVGVASLELFVPLFLQRLHGRTPFEAGYLAALISLGWSVAAFFSSGLAGAARNRAVRVGPVLTFVGMACLALTMPHPAQGWAQLPAMALSLLGIGLGAGMAYTHITTRSLAAAPAEEADSAATGVMTTQLCATAFGAALAGLVFNTAGTAPAGGDFDLGASARWLLGLAAVTPLFCGALIWRVWR